MKHSSLFLSLLGLASILLCGCADKDSIFTETEQAPFVLTATQGDQTRMVVGEDGNTTYWQDGDHLYLVDVTGEKQTVTLTTTLAEPATRARFVAEKSVLSGDYYVLYGTNNVNKNYSNSPTLRDLENITNSNLYAFGYLTVEDGQTSASINLGLVYARLKFNITNKDALSNGEFYCGMWSPSIGFLEAAAITTEGLVPANNAKNLRRIDFGRHSTSTENTAIVLPRDLRGEKVYFYVYGTDNSGNHITYEFAKDGVNLEGGKSYNITLNLDNADQVTTLAKNSDGLYPLNNAQEFRAAAYWNNTSVEYKVNADVDFAGLPYFEINAKGMKGDNHILRNISIGFPGNALGVLKQGYMQDLTLENINIQGLDSIGAFVAKGNSNLSNCTLQGTNVINGKAYIGGLAGYLNHGSSGYVKNCTVTGNTTVIGSSEYVGGIIGYDSYTTLEKCTFNGDITNNGAYTGGLVGYSSSNSSINNCSTSGSITANGSCGGLIGRSYSSISVSSSHSSCDINVSENTKDEYSKKYVGGLVGFTSNTAKLEKCYFEGTLTSSIDCTGGLVGNGSITLTSCYNKGTITVSGGKSYVGGLAGYNSNATISRSYNMGNITCPGQSYVGGLCGYTNYPKINESFCKADVVADNGTYVGGLVGYAENFSSSGYYLKNSYMIGNVSGSAYTGGVAGYGYGTIKNTYFYGNVSTGYGIVYSGRNVNNNLTSTSVVYNSYNSQSDNITNCGPSKTYLSYIDIINGEEAYSTQCWKDIDAKCPLLQWQAEIFSGETETPGYTPVEW